MPRWSMRGLLSTSSRDFPLAQLLVGEIREQQERTADALALYRGSRSEIAALLDGAAARGARARRARPHRRGDGRSSQAMAAERPTRARAAGRARRHPARPRALRRGGVAPMTRAIARTRRSVGAANGGIFYSRGVALERSGQWPRAEADLKHALELQPDQPLVLNYLGYSWIDKGENLAEGAADDPARGRAAARMTATSSTAWAGPIIGSAISRSATQTARAARSSCCPRIRPSTTISAMPIGAPAGSPRRATNGAARCSSGPRPTK